MAKFSNKGLLSIAVILAGVVALLVYNVLSDVQPTAKEDAVVVVAKVEILPNTKITSDMVEQVNIPGTFLQPKAMTDINQVVGVYSKEHIMAREQITERLVVGEGRIAGFTGLIPQDKRAITIAVSDVSGVAGLIKPGDYVDLIVVASAGKDFASLALQNVLVLATDKTLDRGDTGSAIKGEGKIATITLALTPDEATTVVLAQKKGYVHLSLRPFPRTDGIAQVGVKTMSSLGGEYAPVTTTAAPPAYSQERRSYYGKSVSVIRGTKTEAVPVR